MSRSTGRLVVAVITAGILLAAPVSGVSRPQRPASRCHQRFWMGQGLRYARRIYAGTRTTLIREMKHLGRMEHCQHNRHARVYTHHQARMMRHAHRLRVDQANSHPWSTSYASWYDAAGGPIACGGDSYAMGVASRTLPCGTSIEVCYSGCVDAVVFDYGPAAWTGRDMDLSRQVKDAIGFGGLGTVRWRLR